MNLKLITTTIVAVSIVGAAMADGCACCKAMDKFEMQAMMMAKNAKPIKGDRWSSDCKMACCSKDGKHTKHAKKKTKKVRRR